MTITTIDKSQRTAAKVAAVSGLFSMAIVVFANYGLIVSFWLLFKGLSVEPNQVQAGAA